MHQPKPDWLRIRVQDSKNRVQVEKTLAKLSLHTVCEEADCPNLMDCFSRGTTTFMILGRVCTRNCTFCNVEKGITQPVNFDEPLHVAQAVQELNLKHVVVTSVTRDDLADGGAGHFAEVIRNIRELDKNVVIEVLIPDFKGQQSSLLKVIEAKPEIINHNIETIPRLYPKVRPLAVYERSLELLKNIKTLGSGILSKSGIMVGLGETEDEVIQTLQDLKNMDCDILTIGQYLAPSKHHHPVIEYIHPDTFAKYKKLAEEMGFKYVASGPLVRSSYMADKALE